MDTKTSTRALVESMSPVESESKSPSLAYYIKNAYREGDISWQGRVFNSRYHAGDPGPTLRKNRCNGILFYPGCFNPPHLGHMALLDYAFHNAGDDLNLIAAIVQPVSDRGVQRKVSNEVGGRPEDALSKRTRAALWTGHKESRWFWVYDHDSLSCDRFRDRLLSAIRQDGFEVNFICLMGPDHVTVNGPASALCYGIEDILTSSGARATDFVDPNVTAKDFDEDDTPVQLTTLPWFHPWEKLTFNDDYWKKLAREDAEWMHEGVCKAAPPGWAIIRNGEIETVQETAKRLLTAYLSRSKIVRVCRYIGYPPRTIRFIPQASRMDPISSTQIRQMIRTRDGNDLVRGLRGLALNPEELATAVAKYKPAPARPPKVVEKTPLKKSSSKHAPISKIRFRFSQDPPQLK